MGIKKFRATIIRNKDMDAGYIEIPFDVEKEFGAKRVKVVAKLDGVVYRGSLVRMGTSCHILGITKDIRAKMGKSFGDVIDVEIEKDEEERKVEMPANFSEALSKNPKALLFYKSLSYTEQRKYVLWIETAKKEETRVNRVTESVSMLGDSKKK